MTPWADSSATIDLGQISPGPWVLLTWWVLPVPCDSVILTFPSSTPDPFPLALLWHPAQGLAPICCSLNACWLTRVSTILQSLWSQNNWPVIASAPCISQLLGCTWSPFLLWEKPLLSLPPSSLSHLTVCFGWACPRPQQPFSHPKQWQTWECCWSRLLGGKSSYCHIKVWRGIRCLVFTQMSC